MSRINGLAAPLLAAALLAACGKGDGVDDTPDGKEVHAARAAVADTGMPLGATPTAGGVTAVTTTDAKSVRDATEYKLTNENFARFVAATDSLNALRRRDTAVASFINREINDAGGQVTVTANNAGRVRLENHPAISRAIEGTGMSVRDYFVASIAIAQAERFMGSPNAAPPTPVLGPNAEFLNAHKAELDRLRAARGQ
ncbi:MAG: hypothetical protein JWL60_274 [Gemmatimonadetes bacterium]|jgi:hypothetical protein|nr:hypothetical protein [Gemmatimonadota bacterium]